MSLLVTLTDLRCSLILGIIYTMLDMYLWFPYSGKMYQGMFNKINGTKQFYMREKEWYFGALVWLAGGIGLWFLVLKQYQNTPKPPIKTLWFKAAILGFVGYVLFNFTNYFLIKNYDLKVAFVDTAYGTIAFPVIITIYLYLKKYLKM